MVEDKSILTLTHHSVTNGQLIVDKGGGISLGGTHTFTSHSVINSNGTLSVSSGSMSIFSSHLKLSQITASGYRYANPLTNLMIVIPVGWHGHIGSLSINSVRASILDPTSQGLAMESITLRGIGVLEIIQTVTVERLEMWDTTTMMLSSAHLVVTEKYLFSGGRLAGPGHIELVGTTNISAVSLTVEDMVVVVKGRMNFIQTGSLQFQREATLQIAKKGVLTFVAPRCSILGNNGVIENSGVIRTGIHHTGTSRIAVGLFKNRGTVSVESLLQNIIDIQTNTLFTGKAEISEKGKLLLSRSVDGLHSAFVSGGGTLVSTGSSVKLAIVNVPFIEVHGGKLEIATSTEELELSELRVTSGSCTVHGMVAARSVLLSGGVLTLLSPSSLFQLKLSDAALLDLNAKMVVHDAVQWLGGTFHSSTSQQLVTNSLAAYGSSAKTIQSVTFRISSTAKFHGYGMSIGLESGAVLEILSDATAEVAGGSVVFNSKDGSGIYQNFGQTVLLASNVRMSLPVHNMGHIKVNKGVLDVAAPSQSEGVVEVSKESTLLLSSTLLSSESAEIRGDGHLQLTYQSLEIIPIPRVSIQSVTVNHGRHFIYLQSDNSHFSSLTMSDGQLFIGRNFMSTGGSSMTVRGRFCIWRKTCHFGEVHC